jgi:hypothetical protein
VVILTVFSQWDDPVGMSRGPTPPEAPKDAACKILRKSAATKNLVCLPAINGDPRAALSDLGIPDREQAAARSPL